MSFVRNHLSTIVVAGVTAVACGTGGAIAGGMITGADIKDGTVTGSDVKDGSLHKQDLAASTASQLTGPKGDRGHRGLKGKAGLVRGWALVSGAGHIVAQSGGITITHVTGSGLYCLKIPGVTTTAPVITPNLNYDHADSGDNALEVDAEADTGDCGAGITGVYILHRVTNPSTHVVTTSFADDGFDILIP